MRTIITLIVNKTCFNNIFKTIYKLIFFFNFYKKLNIEQKLIKLIKLFYFYFIK